MSSRKRKMKKIMSLLLAASVCVCFTACEEKNPRQENTRAEYTIENADDKVNEFDFENIYAMCKTFLKRYYEAAMSGKRFDSGELVTNESFQQYIQLKLEYGKYVTRTNLSVSLMALAA